MGLDLKKIITSLPGFADKVYTKYEKFNIFADKYKIKKTSPKGSKVIIAETEESSSKYDLVGCFDAGDPRYPYGGYTVYDPITNTAFSSYSGSMILDPDQVDGQ